MSAFTFHNSIKIHLVPIIIVSNNYFQYYLIWRLLISLFITPSLSSSHVLLHSTKSPKPKDLHFTVMCGKKKNKKQTFQKLEGENIFVNASSADVPGQIKVKDIPVYALELLNRKPWEVSLCHWAPQEQADWFSNLWGRKLCRKMFSLLCPGAC